MALKQDQLLKRRYRDKKILAGLKMTKLEELNSSQQRLAVLKMLARHNSFLVLKKIVRKYLQVRYKKKGKAEAQRSVSDLDNA